MKEIRGTIRKVKESKDNDPPVFEVVIEAGAPMEIWNGLSHGDIQADLRMVLEGDCDLLCPYIEDLCHTGDEDHHENI